MRWIVIGGNVDIRIEDLQQRQLLLIDEEQDLCGKVNRLELLNKSLLSEISIKNKGIVSTSDYIHQLKKQLNKFIALEADISSLNDFHQLAHFVALSESLEKKESDLRSSSKIIAKNLKSQIALLSDDVNNDEKDKCHEVEELHSAVRLHLLIVENRR